MKIIDYTSNYIQHVCNNNDFDSYEKCCPELFEHYYKFWSKKDRDNIFNEPDIELSANKITSFIAFFKDKFKKQKFNTNQLTIILFVGAGNTNGHAFKYKNKFFVWIPVETYKTETDIKIFITHEIAHALHYKHSPDFYFNNHDEQLTVGRQLITEGLATYFSKRILSCSNKKALWGDYIDSPSYTKWMNACENQISQIKSAVLDNFDKPELTGLFQANDKSDVLNYRAGYYLGLQLIEQFVENNFLSLEELLQIPRPEFENDIKQTL